MVKQYNQDICKTVDLHDFGLAWKDIDRLSIRDVLLISHNSIKQRNCHDIRLAVVKGSFLILMQLEINENEVSSLKLIKHVAFGTGPSSIVNVEHIEDNEIESTFIVACREGPFHLLTVPTKELSSASLQTIDISEFFTKSSDGASIDTKNYRCHGLKKSKGGCIWVFLQNGLLDEQVKFTKGKLTILTQSTFSSISRAVMDKCNSKSGDNIPKNKDLLEIFRILACSDYKFKTNGDSVSEMFMNLIQNDIKLCQKTTLGVEQMQIYLWICQLFATISTDDEIIMSWDSLAEELHRDILSVHAQKILHMFASEDSSLNSDIYDIESISSIYSFYLNFARSDNRFDDLEIPKYKWKCKFCDKEELKINLDSYVDCFYCAESQHKWPRCVLTLKLCDDKNLSKCKWCESVTFKSHLKGYRNLNCSLCHGPFISS